MCPPPSGSDYVASAAAAALRCCDHLADTVLNLRSIGWFVCLCVCVCVYVTVRTRRRYPHPARLCFVVVLDLL